MASAVLPLAMVGIDAALVLGALGFLFSPSGGDRSANVVELRFIRCHCDDPKCAGVRRVRASLASSPAF